jgi:hypothetical protein
MLGGMVFYAKGVPYTSLWLRWRYSGYSLYENPTPTVLNRANREWHGLKVLDVGSWAHFV